LRRINPVVTRIQVELHALRYELVKA
jgi:hypothetical protein